MDRFDILQFSYEPEGEHRNAWRIFDMDFTGNYDDYPEDSYIRRAYKTYMKNGGITGGGRGIFFYDQPWPEKGAQEFNCNDKEIASLYVVSLCMQIQENSWQNRKDML